MSSTRSGFTLIEVMVVVTILSIAAALLIPRFLHHQAETEPGTSVKKTLGNESNPTPLPTSLPGNQ